VVRPLVSVVDDDESIRESLPDLLKELGFEARAFAAAAEFLASDALDQTRCLLLDIAMPGMSGPELQRELLRQGRAIPIIFITAQGDEKVRAALLSTGAVGVPAATGARTPVSVDNMRMTSLFTTRPTGAAS
jgi:FixJ family two-component response regulator